MRLFRIPQHVVALPTRREIGKIWIGAIAGGLPLIAAAQVGGSEVGSYRRLAPGVETTIPADVRPEETLSLQAIPAFRADQRNKWQPNYGSPSRTLYEMARSAEYPREAWCLQLSFKPLRMIRVDIPQPSGKMQRKLIWYMVYRVTNTGKRLKPGQGDEAFKTVEAEGKPVRFFPSFVLESHERDAAGARIYKAYLDRILPTVIDPIQRREDPNRELLTSAEMAGEEIPLSTPKEDHSVWGVVTWEDVDPQLDFFSVYVTGLTNAFKWEDPKGVFKPGDPPGRGRKLFPKSLQLNFWRPGDEIREHEEEIRLGVPKGLAELYDSEEGVAYQWVYR